MTANLPSETVAPAILVTTAPASETPDLAICSEPMASVDAADFERSASNCLMSLLSGDEANTLGAALKADGGAIAAVIFVLPRAAPASLLLLFCSSPKKLWSMAA